MTPIKPHACFIEAQRLQSPEKLVKIHELGDACDDRMIPLVTFHDENEYTSQRNVSYTC